MANNQILVEDRPVVPAPIEPTATEVISNVAIPFDSDYKSTSPPPPSLTSPSVEPSPRLAYKVRPHATLREWNALVGGFKTEAMLVGFVDGLVELEKPDGKQVKVPIEKLSRNDWNYVHGMIREVEESFVFIGKVQSIVDGDTFVAIDEEQKSRTIHLLGVDAPELDQDHGTAAHDALSALLSGKSPWIEWKTSDGKGDFLGIVFLNGTLINSEIISNGHAWYEETFGTDERFKNAFVFAQKERTGLWKALTPSRPSDFRTVRSLK
ncbi:MAG: thermonuclease family protein [Pirellulaceae bacterium]|nr:thermonuclease family protein [Pirellulaceae bacterium]